MLNCCKHTFLLLLLCFVFFISQAAKIDSLLNVLKQHSREDTVKVKLLNDLAEQYVRSNQYAKGRSSAEEALKLANNLEFTEGKAKAYKSISFSYYYQGNYRAMLDYMNRLLDIRLKEGNKKFLANVYGNIGVAYWGMGDYPNAYDAYFKSLKLCEELNDPEGVSTNELNLGILSWNLGKFEEALSYYQRSLLHNEKVGDKKSVANLYGNMANVYHSMMELDKCLDYNNRALRLREELGDSSDIADSYTNLANLMSEMKQLSKMKEYHQKALSVKRKLGDVNGAAIILRNMAEAEMAEGAMQRALELLKEALALAKESEDLHLIREVYDGLYQAYEKLGNHSQALIYYKEYVNAKDSLMSEKNIQKMTEAQMNYEFDKKQREEQLVQEQKDRLVEEEGKRQSMIRNFLIAGCFGLLIIALLIFRSFTQSRHANSIIAAQKKEVEHQKSIVDQKNKDMTDSISYAQRIQHAVFPEKELMIKIFPDAFIYFRPRDIVSGDFYWFAEKSGIRFIAAVDCTGHGVPGAFMSIIGNHLLDEIVLERGIAQPAEILNNLHKRVRAVLKQQDQRSRTPDGMDIALCAFYEDGKVQYAGAQRPAWVVSQGALREVKADKFPIGGSDEQAGSTFTNNDLGLNRGDILYISSDGYADQFGGHKGKKMMSKNFKELLLANSSRTMQEQEQILDESMKKWKGSREQVDDILVIGVRV